MTEQQKPRVRRSERGRRRRAAWHAGRVERAASAVDRMAAAADYLTSAVAHAPNPARAARPRVAEVAGHARQVMDRPDCDLSEAGRRLHESRLAERGSEVARLSVALMVLRSVIARLPTVESERMAAHYATELSREATDIASRR